jgi:hypothetical protein
MSRKRYKVPTLNTIHMDYLVKELEKDKGRSKVGKNGNMYELYRCI